MMESWEHSKVLLVELLGIYHFRSLARVCMAGKRCDETRRIS